MITRHYYNKIIKFKATYYDGIIEGRDGLPFFVSTDGSNLSCPVDIRISVYENIGRIVRIYEIPYLKSFLYYEPANCWFTNDGMPPSNMQLIENRKQAERLFRNCIAKNMVILSKYYIIFILVSLLLIALMLLSFPIIYKIIITFGWLVYLKYIINSTKDARVVHIKDASGKLYRFEV